MLIAMSSGLVFNAFTLLLPKLMQERLAGNATLLPLVGLAAFLVTLCGALTQFSVGRMIDREPAGKVQGDEGGRGSICISFYGVELGPAAVSPLGRS